MNLGFEVIAVDFDGTLCTDIWPEIGEPNVKLIRYLRNRHLNGDKLILWTCRTGDRLQEAINWCIDQEIPFSEVNQNIKEVNDMFGIHPKSPKIFADIYIDDKASNHLTMPFIKDVGKFSDGYHTFDGLYAQRRVLFATLCNLFKNSSWKSKRHSDGELCFGGGWFIVGIDTPEGSFTYHYQMEYWKMFDCPVLEVGKEWDGHTEEDVGRLLSLENTYGTIGKKSVTIDLEEYKDSIKDGLSYSMSSDHGGCKYSEVL